MVAVSTAERTVATAATTLIRDESACGSRAGRDGA
jgi:hypothetical protein